MSVFGDLYREWLRNRTERRYRETLHNALLLGNNMFLDQGRRKLYVDQAYEFRGLVIKRSGPKVERIIHSTVVAEVENEKAQAAAESKLARDRADGLIE